MLRLALSILIASLLAGLVGCSRGDDNHRGYDSKSGDLGAFILRMAPQYGVCLLTTNGLPAIPAKRRSKCRLRSIERSPGFATISQDRFRVGKKSAERI